MRFVLLAGGHFGISLLIWRGLHACIPPLTEPLPNADAYVAHFFTPQYLFLKNCQFLTELPIYRAFRPDAPSPILLLLNSAAFALIVWAGWKGWRLFRKKWAPEPGT